MSRKNKKKTTGFSKRTCVLCGRTIITDGSDSCVTGSTGRVVCRPCLRTSKAFMDAFEKQPESEAAEVCVETKTVTSPILTPQEIIAQLDRRIIGQEDAKRAVAIAMWKQQLRANGDVNVPGGNLLLYGPTGCGKTALVREASKIVELPFIAFDATTLSETGYRGRDALEIVQDLAKRFQEHPHLKNGVVFLDEVDKLAAIGGETRMAYNRGTQHALLKLIEGSEVDDLSTEGMLFIFGGAFSSLTSQRNKSRGLAHPIGFGDKERMTASAHKEISITDFVDFGMEAELMGRIGQCIPLQALTRDEMQKILLESELSVFRQYQRFFLSRGVQLQISNKQVDSLIDDALARGSGARGLNALLEEAIQPLLFRLAEGSADDRMTVNGGSDRVG